MVTVFADTSSIVAVNETGSDPWKNHNKIYTTNAMKANEIDTFDWKGMVSSSLMGKIDSQMPATGMNGSKLVQIREDVLNAHYAASNEKKIVHDPISDEDVAFMTLTIAYCLNGKKVEVYSEDKHITKTLSYMMEHGYKSLKRLMEVKSIKD